MFADRIYQPPYFQCNLAPMKPNTPFPGVAQIVNHCANAIPVLSLNQSLVYPLALGVGVLRAITFYQEGCYWHTAAAVSSLALTIVSHPLGMLVMTGHDIAIGCAELAQVQSREAQILCIAKIFKNTLYLTLFFHQGIGLAVASLTVQMSLQLYTAYQQKEWQPRFAYLGLTLVSLALCKNLMQQKWEMEQVYRIQPYPYPINP